jgi:hypothetical protein
MTLEAEAKAEATVEEMVELAEDINLTLTHKINPINLGFILWVDIFQVICYNLKYTTEVIFMPSTTYRFVQKVIEFGGLLPTIRFDCIDPESDLLKINVSNKLLDRVITRTVEVKLNQGSLMFNYEDRRIWDTSIVDFKPHHAQSMILEVANVLEMSPIYSGFDVYSITRSQGRGGGNVHWIKVKLWTPAHMNDHKPVNMVKDVMVIEPTMTLDAFFGTSRLLLGTNTNTISIDDLRSQQDHPQFMRYEWEHFPDFSGIESRQLRTINNVFEKDIRSFVNSNM